MKLIVTDRNGDEQTIVVNGVATVSDKSTTIAVADEPQDILDANPDRGGYFLQNLGSVPLLVCEIDEDASAANAFQIEPLGTWPPANYPVTTSRVSIASSEVDARIVAREW